MPGVVVAVASGPPELTQPFARAAEKFAGGLPLYVFSELPADAGIWIPHRLERSAREELARIRAELGGREILFVCLLLTPHPAFQPLRRLALRLGGLRVVFFNENLDYFRLQAGTLPLIGNHVRWRARSWLKFQVNPGGQLYTWAWRMRDPVRWRRSILYRLSLIHI